MTKIADAISAANAAYATDGQQLEAGAAKGSEIQVAATAPGMVGSTGAR
jgi:hypothetical protein